MPLNKFSAIRKFIKNIKINSVKIKMKVIISIERVLIILTLSLIYYQGS